MTQDELNTIKDVLLMQLIVERGGQWALTYEEVERIGKEFDGYAVMLLGSPQGIVLKVHSPKVTA